MFQRMVELSFQSCGRCRRNAQAQLRQESLNARQLSWNCRITRRNASATDSCEWTRDGRISWRFIVRRCCCPCMNAHLKFWSADDCSVFIFSLSSMESQNLSAGHGIFRAMLPLIRGEATRVLKFAFSAVLVHERGTTLSATKVWRQFVNLYIFANEGFGRFCPCGTGVVVALICGTWCCKTWKAAIGLEKASCASLSSLMATMCSRRLNFKVESSF